MEILETFDLTGSLRGAAELAGCDHKTVGHWVRAREEAGGGLPAAAAPRPVVGAFSEKVEELVERSHGKIRADKAHETLVAMGYLGSERTTRRAVAEAKRRHRQQHGRRTRPWIPEPGPLRAERRDLRARRSAEQGRLGGDGADRQGGSGPDRSQTASGVCGLRRARGRVRALLRARQRARAQSHAPAAGGAASGGA